MTMTYAQLSALDPADWRYTATAWHGLAATVADAAQDLTGLSRDLAVDWSGPAATAATRKVTGLSGRLGACRVPLARTEQLLITYADRLAQAKSSLAATLAAAEGTRVRVGSDGRALLDVTGGAPQPWEMALLASTEAGVAATVALADRADTETGRALTELALDAENRWPASPAPGPPTTGPAAVALWWTALTPAQRRWLIDREPELVGGLDGVPAADRDLANRDRLADEQDRLRRQHDILRGREGAHGELARVEARLAGLAVIEGRLGADNPRAYLLGLDTKADGRVIIALGDPDHADNVLTFVPGSSTALDRDISGSIDRTAAMGAAATAADPAARTASILWLGYDAPDNVATAISAGYAHAARADLHDFQDGLAATHDGAIGQQTVVGHSYGTLVIGETSRDLGLRADDLVLLGSAGAGVSHAAALDVDPGTVWAATAGHDPIQYGAPSLKQLIQGLPAGRHLGEPLTDLWHGHNPADPGFGGRIFASADGGSPIRAHSSYWDSGNPAMDGVGAIASGHDDRLH